MKALTIIVLTKNPTLDFVKKCLDNITLNTRVSYELILIRDSPKDFGYSKEVNRAIRISETENIVLINDDVFVSKNWFEKMNRENADIIGGLKEEGYNKYVCFALALIRKRVFDKIGMLDESYKFGYEDTEFCIRALKNNFVLKTIDTGSEHLGKRTSISFYPQIRKAQGALRFWNSLDKPIPFLFMVVFLDPILLIVNMIFGRQFFLNSFMPKLRLVSRNAV